MPDASTNAALRAAVRAALDQITANSAAVRAGTADGIHQMRVGVRRLRAALAIFAPVIEDEGEPTGLRQDLKWLAAQLGRARDLQMLDRRLRRKPGAHGALTEAVVPRLRSAVARAGRAVASRRYRALIGRCARWLDALAEQDDAGPSARAFAKAELARRARRVVKRARKLDRLSAEKRHRLRVAAKTLNYAIDVFGSLAGGSKAQARLLAFQAELKALLDDLGRLNDLAVHDALTDHLGRRGGAVLRSEADALKRLRADKAARVLRSAMRAAKRLARLRLPFD